MRIIDADALLEGINDMISNVAFTSPYQDEINIMLQGMERVRDCIEEAPTIDPESLRPRGRWVQNGQCNHKPCRIKNTDRWKTYKCSVCGASNGRYKRHNYCHNCGAKMDEEEDK